jgi:hypothetical protein
VVVAAVMVAVVVVVHLPFLFGVDLEEILSIQF